LGQEHADLVSLNYKRHWYQMKPHKACNFRKKMQGGK